MKKKAKKYPRPEPKVPKALDLNITFLNIKDLPKVNISNYKGFILLNFPGSLFWFNPHEAERFGRAILRAAAHQKQIDQANKKWIKWHTGG